MAGQLVSSLSRSTSAFGRLSRASQAEDGPDIETPMLAANAASSSSRPVLGAVEIDTGEAPPDTPSKDALQVCSALACGASSVGVSDGNADRVCCRGKAALCG